MSKTTFYNFLLYQKIVASGVAALCELWNVECSCLAIIQETKIVEGTHTRTRTRTRESPKPRVGIEEKEI